MKKLIIFLFAAVLITNTVFAEGIREQQPQQNQRQELQRYREKFQTLNERWRNFYSETERSRQREINTVTIEGTLKLERGIVAVDSGTSVHLVPMLNRYIGFISELKEGTFVTVTGYEFRNFLQPVKVAFEDKSYDFMGYGRNLGFGNQDPNRTMQRSSPHNMQRSSPRSRENLRPNRSYPPPVRMNTPGRHRS